MKKVSRLRSFSKVGLPALSILLIAQMGCTTDSSSVVYTPEEAQRAQTVETGTIKSIQAVTIQSKETGAGGIGGSVAGGFIGSTIGGGNGAILTSVAGSIAGAFAGKAAEREIGRKNASEIEVEKLDGTLLSIVQENDVKFEIGEKVRLIKAPNGKYRITKQK